MAGHSKWANIKHRKGAQDAKRAKVFTVIARMITLAAQSGGGDPETNPALKVAIDKARSVNMPKENIQRAIDRGTGAASAGARMEEVVYEAMGPDGAAMMIVCATDNTNRTLTDVKTTLKKAGGKFVSGGGVAFQFQRCGQITIAADDPEAVELAAIDAGAEDVVRRGDVVHVFTSVEDFHAVREALAAKGFPISDAQLIYRAQQPVALSPEAAATMATIVEAIEACDDVQAVFTNVAEA